MIVLLNDCFIKNLWGPTPSECGGTYHAHFYGKFLTGKI